MACNQASSGCNYPEGECLGSFSQSVYTHLAKRIRDEVAEIRAWIKQNPNVPTAVVVALGDDIYRQEKLLADYEYMDNITRGASA